MYIYFNSLVWDLRRFDKPVKAVHNLPNFFAETDCIFSPNEKYIITGISVKKGADEGKLFFFDRYNLSLKQEMNVSKSSVVRILWHPKINQVIHV